MFWLLGYEAYGILAPWLGIEPVSLALEGRVPAIQLLGKSPLKNFSLSNVAGIILVIGTQR